MAAAGRPTSVLTGLSVLLMLAACGPSEPATSEPAGPAGQSPAATDTAEVLDVTFITSGGINLQLQPVLYADEMGIFDRHGLNVELIHLTDNPTAVQALVAGVGDVVFSGYSTCVTARGGGGPVKAITSVAPGIGYFLVAQTSIPDLQALEGRTFGVSAPGAVSYHAPRIVMEREGVDIESIEYLAIGNDQDRARALIAGTVDAAVINEIETPVALEESENLHVLYDVGTAIREDFLATAICATEETIAAKPDELQRVVTALMEASRELESDPDGAVEFAASTGLDREAVENAVPLILDAEEPYWGVNGGITQAAVENTVELLIEQGSLEAPLTYDELIDPQFLDGALEELGEYS